MSTLAYILLAASGGSKDSNFFLGAATGASANSRSQDTFKFSQMVICILVITQQKPPQLVRVLVLPNLTKMMFQV